MNREDNSGTPGDLSPDPLRGDKIVDSNQTDRAKEVQVQGHREVGGPTGPEPTRYGDWEKGGRCIDF